MRRILLAMAVLLLLGATACGKTAEKGAVTDTDATTTTSDDTDDTSDDTSDDTTDDTSDDDPNEGRTDHEKEVLAAFAGKVFDNAESSAVVEEAVAGVDDPGDPDDPTDDTSGAAMGEFTEDEALCVAGAVADVVGFDALEQLENEGGGLAELGVTEDEVNEVYDAMSECIDLSSVVEAALAEEGLPPDAAVCFEDVMRQVVIDIFLTGEEPTLDGELGEQILDAMSDCEPMRTAMAEMMAEQAGVEVDVAECMVDEMFADPDVRAALVASMTGDDTGMDDPELEAKMTDMAVGCLS